MTMVMELMVPKLSIVVPFYNVEPYFAECLTSLANQSLDDLEVIMVDDGSPDRSVDIAQAFADRDARFRLIRQDNAGLGAARNAGTAQATGEYLAFVDSDDVIPPYAYEYMTSSLEETGSDFASGNVHRLDDRGTRQSPMHRKIFVTECKRTHISERDTLLIDRLSTNKVWRRSFWDAHRFAFPEGVLYEDIAVVLPAHFLATSIDVLPACVYYWRTRPAEDKSITQDRLHIKGLEDRVLAVRSVSRFLAERGRTSDKRRWDRTALGSDLRLFLQVLADADEDFRQRFLDLTNEFIDQAGADVLDELPAIERLKWHLVRERRMTELLDVLTFQASVEIKKAPLKRRRLRYYGDYPFFENSRLKIPRRVFEVGRQLDVRQKVEHIAWQGDRLIIEGRAGIARLQARRRFHQFMFAWLVDAQTGKRKRLPTKHLRVAEFALPLDPQAARMDWGGYRIEVDTQKLRSSGSWRAATWQIELWVLNRGMLRKSLLSDPVSGAPKRPTFRAAAPDVWIRPTWTDERALQIKVELFTVSVREHSVDGDVLTLSGEIAAGVGDGAIRLSMLPGGITRTEPVQTAPPGNDGRRTFTARFSISELVRPSLAALEMSGTQAAMTWRAEAVSGDRREPIVLADGAQERRHTIGEEEVAVLRSHAGYLTLTVRATRPLIDAITWRTNGRLEIAGSYAPGVDGRVELVLKARGRNEEHVFPLQREGGRFLTELAPGQVASFAGVLPLGRGRYDCVVRVWHGPDTWRDLETVIEHDFVRTLPLESMVDGRSFAVVEAGQDRAVLSVSDDLHMDERGRFAQRVLREEFYPAQRLAPVRDETLFESYSGKQFSDSPRGIFEEMQKRAREDSFSWIVRDGQVALPAGMQKIRHAGREYFDSLARARTIVTNAHLPVWFGRRPEQKVVQTWHGSMLKRIGFDIERIRFASRNYHERLEHEVRQWNYLISPSPWATPILRRAFRFEGEILETGYPRNDLFYGAEREALTAEVRKRVGLPADKKVVFYAPTWRDDKFYAPGRYMLDLHLDLQRLYEELGSDHVLMVRRHPNVVDRIPMVGKDFIYDVSVYPEVQELYLVTDILVTDYSSLMFDFANTRRPMLFFTYDLEEYRDKLRGFYFDFEETAPGPLLMTSNDVVEAIKNIAEVHATHREKYQSFLNLYCPLDDGKAAARVVDRVFGDLG